MSPIAEISSTDLALLLRRKKPEAPNPWVILGALLVALGATVGLLR